MSPRSVTLRWKQRGQERGLRGLGRAVGRAQALDLGGDHRRRDPQHRRRRRRRRAARRRRRPTTASPTRSSCVSTPVGVAHQRALVGGRARGDREHGARAVDQDERRVEGTGGGADDLGEPEAGLHRVRHRPERAEVGQRRLLAGGRGHAASLDSPCGADDLRIRLEAVAEVPERGSPTPAPASTNAARM